MSNEELSTINNTYEIEPKGKGEVENICILSRI